MHPYRLLAFCAACLASLAVAQAVTTQKWETNSAGDFSRGKLTNLIVNNAGEVSLGYGRQKLGEFGKEIWSSAALPGGTIYFGTGSPAQIFRVNPADKKPEAKRIFEAPGIAITAMAADSKGILYAGAIADGKVYRAQGAEVKEFCQLPDAYVWALAVDAKDQLFAATGPNGNIYRIDNKGVAEVWWTLPEPNALSLAIAPDGSLYVGGSERGLLYRVTEKGKGTVVHEFPENEIKALTFSADGKSLFIAANKRRAQRAREERKDSRPDGAVGALSQQIEGQGVTGEGVAEPPARISPAEARAVTQLASALYYRDASGRVDRLVEDPSGSMLDLKADATGNVFVATGNEGHVYRVRPDKSWELLFDFDEQQAITIVAHKGDLTFVGAGNVGAAYLIEAQKSKNGEWLSQVQDCGFSSAWGNLDWQARGKIQFSTRSGNTEVPDRTWSDWSASLDTPPAKIQSPRARYLQVRAQWGNGTDAVLSNVAVYYLVQNQKPLVSSVTVDGSQTSAQQPKPATKSADETSEKNAEPAPQQTAAKSADTNPLKRPRPHITQKRIRWQAEDKDGDKLEFTLFYKAEEDKIWIPFPLPKPLDKPEYIWDTDSIPDGRYRVKVVASDRPGNPADDTLSDEKISDMFVIDNTRPVVTLKAFDAATSKITGTASDSLSPIQFLEYSVNGGEWQFFAPLDRIFDSTNEPFEFTLRDLPPGLHHAAVRAIDADGNIGVGRLTIEVKK